MHLLLTRRWFTLNSTIGDLTLDGQWLCFILEDVVRPSEAPKVYGATAIPYGCYEIALTHSPRFGRILPLLVGVPGFEGVRIHPGNTARDTEGCLLPGHSRTLDAVGQSRLAFASLFARLESAKLRAEKLTIEIVKG
ncbi:MAG: hypothetical protein E6Q97_00335 [Desulfurellales bacterium]|nr:MAG: hypothetical protein E6Q97_00335 [Desulfurellales bacterium]